MAGAKTSDPSPSGAGFRATVELNGKTATGIKVPAEVVERLGGKRPAVRVTLNGYRYRSTVASMGGEFLLSISAEHRAGAGVAAGDEVDVLLELDSEPRELTVPADLREALTQDLGAMQFFDGLSYSHRQRHVLSVEGAKTPETRQRRINKTLQAMRDGARIIRACISGEPLDISEITSDLCNLHEDTRLGPSTATIVGVMPERTFENTYTVRVSAPPRVNRVMLKFSID